MGRTVFALITPEICCSCFNSWEEETMNFILSFLSLIGQKIVVLESAVNIFTNVINGCVCGETKQNLPSFFRTAGS
jgi:hypothetical protein